MESLQLTAMQIGNPPITPAGGGATTPITAPQRTPKSANSNSNAWQPLQIARESYFGREYQIVDLRGPLPTAELDRYIRQLSRFYMDGFNQVGEKTGVETPWPNPERVEAMLRHRLKIPGVAFMVCPRGNDNQISGIFIMENELGLTVNPRRQIEPRLKAVELDVLVDPKLQGTEGLGSKITLYGLNAMAEHGKREVKGGTAAFEAVTYTEGYQDYWWNRLGFKSSLLFSSEIGTTGERAQALKEKGITIERLTLDQVGPAVKFLQSSNIESSLKGRWNGHAEEFVKFVARDDTTMVACVAKDHNDEVVGFASSRVSVRRSGIVLRDMYCAIQAPSTQPGRRDVDAEKRKTELLVGGLAERVARDAQSEISSLYGINAGVVHAEFGTSSLDFYGKHIKKYDQDRHYLLISSENLNYTCQALVARVDSPFVFFKDDLTPVSGNAVVKATPVTADAYLPK